MQRTSDGPNPKNSASAAMILMSPPPTASPLDSRATPTKRARVMTPAAACQRSAFANRPKNSIWTAGPSPAGTASKALTAMEAMATIRIAPEMRSESRTGWRRSQRQRSRSSGRPPRTADHSLKNALQGGGAGTAERGAGPDQFPEQSRLIATPTPARSVRRALTGSLRSEPLLPSSAGWCRSVSSRPSQPLR